MRAPRDVLAREDRSPPTSSTGLPITRTDQQDHRHPDHAAAQRRVLPRDQDHRQQRLQFDEAHHTLPARAPDPSSRTSQSLAR